MSVAPELPESEETGTKPTEEEAAAAAKPAEGSAADPTGGDGDVTTTEAATQQQTQEAGADETQEASPEDSSATAKSLPGGHPEMHAIEGIPGDTRPWMLCIVDHDASCALAEALRPLVAQRLRVIICSTVMQGLKHMQAVIAQGERVAVVLSEEPLAGMTGGGIWGLQKCRALLPDCVRLLALDSSVTSLLSGLAKLKDADVHQVFDIATDAAVVAKRLILPMLDEGDDAVDESLRSATVRANTEVRMLTIPKETFAELLHRDAHLSIGITRELARRLRRQQQK